ncbi:hypothetical protein B0H17DRAFT_1211968 [Mycena rosella]|uniref:Uncharacterized protein n=1 Tax=Mycena rosella TaxID=1033263 RepID=A0AAD7CTA6_MYCRO|nr:hypothetical protein B0H17DRAFT_1211968 [Mycena rosella]
MYTRKYTPQTGTRAVLFPAHPSAHLSFIDKLEFGSRSAHHPGQSSLDTTSTARPLARTLSLIALLPPTFAFSSLGCYTAPLVAATASIAPGSPRWASLPVFPSSPRIPVALATPGRYHNPTTYDIQPPVPAPYDLQPGTSFDARALPTAGASVNSAASPFVPSPTRVDADGGHQNHKQTIR